MHFTPVVHCMPLKKNSRNPIKIEASAASNEIFSEKNWWRSDVGISAYFLKPIKFAVYLLSRQNAPFIQNN